MRVGESAACGRSRRALDVMDERLEHLSRAFQGRVAEAVVLLRSAAIPLPTSTNDWVMTRIPGSGRLGATASYRKHGYGCCVTFPDGEVDFDFGDRAQIDGFDAWRLWRVASDPLSDFAFVSKGEVASIFQAPARAAQRRR